MQTFESAGSDWRLHQNKKHILQLVAAGSWLGCRLVKTMSIKFHVYFHFLSSLVTQNTFLCIWSEKCIFALTVTVLLASIEGVNIHRKENLIWLYAGKDKCLWLWANSKGRVVGVCVRLWMHFFFINAFELKQGVKQPFNLKHTLWNNSAVCGAVYEQQRWVKN